MTGEADETPPVRLTDEELRKAIQQQQRADFELGRTQQHLRLPDGLPVDPREPANSK